MGMYVCIYVYIVYIRTSCTSVHIMILALGSLHAGDYLRVQVPNYHILSKIVTYTPIPNYWILWTLVTSFLPNRSLRPVRMDPHTVVMCPGPWDLKDGPATPVSLI